MSEAEKKIWGIHTQDEALFLKDGKIAIGWKEIGDLIVIPANRDDFKAKYMQVFPDANKGSIPTSVGMLYRFCHEIQIGDYVVYPSKSDRMINIGEVTGNYTYVADAVGAMLLIATNGENGAFYNVANLDNLVSIRDLAELIAGLDPRQRVRVRFADEQSKLQYLPFKLAIMDVSNVQALGWQPRVGLKKAFQYTLEYLLQNCKGA